MSQKTRFSTAMGLLFETFGETLSGVRLQGYWLALNDQKPEFIEVAVKEAIRTCQFFPRPSELRKIAIDLSLETTKRRRLEQRRLALQAPKYLLAAPKPEAKTEVYDTTIAVKKISTTHPSPWKAMVNSISLKSMSVPKAAPRPDRSDSFLTTAEREQAESAIAGLADRVYAGYTYQTGQQPPTELSPLARRALKILNTPENPGRVALGDLAEPQPQQAPDPSGSDPLDQPPGGANDKA